MIAWYWIAALCVAALLRAIGSTISARMPRFDAKGEREQHGMETVAILSILGISIYAGFEHGFWIGGAYFLGSMIVSSLLAGLGQTIGAATPAGEAAMRGLGLPDGASGAEGLLPVLGCVVTVTEDNTFFVRLRRLQPETQDVEYIRMPLHYYAKILFVFDPDDPDMAMAAIMLEHIMDKVLSAGLRPGVDVLALADVGDVARISNVRPQGPSRKMEATLFFVDTARRHVVTEFSQGTYTQQLVFSVLVMIQACLDALDESDVRILAAALSEMQRLYAEGTSYSDLAGLARVPNVAFMAVV